MAEPVPSVILPTTVEIGEKLLGSLDRLDGLIEFCAGYRARCEAAGFSPEVAEQMALTVHDSIIERATPPSA